MKEKGSITEKIKQLNFESTLLVDQLVSFFIEAILSGKLKGGDQLTENELQKHLGISRSPLREAFRELEKRGLVVIIPRKGTFVKTITRKDIEETIPVRAILEGLAAKEAYRRIDDKDLIKAKKIIEKMKKSVQKGDQRLYWEQHVLFHDIFINASGNEVLVNVLRPLRTKTLWYRFSLHNQKEDLEESLEAHKKLLDIFEKKEIDENEIELSARTHVERFLNKYVRYLDEVNNTKT